jgi:hypothetical protein
MQLEDDAPLSFTSRLAESGDLAVPAISVDHYVESTGLARIDFIKIDVEGAEDTVIRGMTNTLQVFHPDVLVEIHGNEGNKSKSLVRLQEAGYELKKVERTGLVPFVATTQVGHVLGVGRV